MRGAAGNSRSYRDFTIAVRLLSENATLTLPLVGPRRTANFPCIDSGKSASAQSDDFSIWMTTKELQWHKWLVSNRRNIATAESIESFDSPSVEANLLRLETSKGIAYSFEWSTTDGKWKGAVSFVDSEDAPGWIRQAASTFELTGDPSTILNATNAKINASIATSQSESTTAR